MENAENTSENTENIGRHHKCLEGHGVTLRSDEECGRMWDWCCYTPRDAPCSSAIESQGRSLNASTAKGKAIQKTTVIGAAVERKVSNLERKDQKRAR